MAKLYRHFRMQLMRKHVIGIEKLLLAPDWKLENFEMLENWFDGLLKRTRDAHECAKQFVGKKAEEQVAADRESAEKIAAAMKQ